MSLAIHRE